MTNLYEPPEVIEIGKAENVVLDQKLVSFMVDNVGVAFMRDGETLDDFDEQRNVIYLLRRFVQLSRLSQKALSAHDRVRARL